MNGGMNYTGTRFLTTQSNGFISLTGAPGAFVSAKLSDQVGAMSTNPYSNAGERQNATQCVQ